MEADDEEDIFYYDISHGEFNMTFAIAKIETTGNCNPLLILISCTLSGQFTNDSLSANTVWPLFPATNRTYPDWYV